MVGNQKKNSSVTKTMFTFGDLFIRVISCYRSNGAHYKFVTENKNQQLVVPTTQREGPKE